MKKVKRLIILLLAVVIVLSACSMPAGMASKEEKLKPGILLCGEMHSDDISIDLRRNKPVSACHRINRLR